MQYGRRIRKPVIDNCVKQLAHLRKRYRVSDGRSNQLQRKRFEAGDSFIELFAVFEDCRLENYFIEKDSIYNRYLSDKSGGPNVAYFTAGILDAFLNDAGFTCKVTAHWHKGTTLMIVFDESRHLLKRRNMEIIVS
ncbi:hypothetical protein MXB_3156 [Myxobolus squamalis]|nr:hypothetical protein MXB_3156 [Myxobolus squamalis]